MAPDTTETTDTTEVSAIDIARRVLKLEAEAIDALVGRLDDNFDRAVDTILKASGKVVVTGMGKSGLICQKIASTLASTGTSSFFLHPAEGVHGDLGVLMKNDVLIAVSNSGETDEILRLIPAVKRLGTPMIVMTGIITSTLAGFGDCVLDVGVREEACPLGLAPTSSTTATLAMGDALAVALLEKKGFRAEDFASLHPAGSLGKKLKTVAEYMHTGDGVPSVTVNTPMTDAMAEMSKKRFGVTGIFEGARLLGIITDGDIRRSLEKGANLPDMTAGEVMTIDPKVVGQGSLVEEALNIMEQYSITSLFVCDAEGKAQGIVHLHDLIRAGVL